MTSVFYDFKKKKKVSARVIGKCVIPTKSGDRYSLIGSGEFGNKMFKFITKNEFMNAKVKIIKK